MTRDQQLTLIYRHTPRDYKGRREDGTRCILVFEPGVGTCSVPLDSLTDAQVANKLAYALRCEEKRRAAP